VSQRAIAGALCAALACAALPAAAQPVDKVIHAEFPIAETGFDPQAAGDIYSTYVNRMIFDPLYRYSYLVRPFKVEPNTATALPQISADGKTWTIKVRPGIYFMDDPVFKGKKRELTAADYVYSIKRILDPKMRSNSVILIEGRFVGADAVVAKAKETGKFDYDAPMEGLKALDRYTLQFTLNFPDYEMLANLTSTSLGAVAREVIEAYGDNNGWTMANPVGTGPYKLKDWRRSQRIVLEANPGYRDDRYPDSADPADRAIIEKVRGRKLPLVKTVEITIIEEANPRLLAFQQGQLDFFSMGTADLTPKVLEPNNTLKPELVKAGVHLQRGIQPAISNFYFNMEDPVVGGMSKEHIALRRAVAMSYNVEEDIRVIRNGQGEPPTQIIPPQMSGHDPTFNARIKYDPAAARALLDKFGYKDRDGDGFRETPDGKPLTIRMASPISAVDNDQDDLWQKNLRAIGLRVEFMKQKWPDLLKAARLGQLQMWRLGNINTNPEGYGFHGLLYGPYAGFSNLARFDYPEYNKLYDEGRALPDSPERTKLARRMSEIVNVYAPWVLGPFRYENVLIQPWVLGYKYSPTFQYPFPYLDIDTAQRVAAGAK